MRTRKHFLLLALLLGVGLLPTGASAQRAGHPELEGAVEIHPSVGLASGAGAGLGIDLRGTFWAARERGYTVGPEVVIGFANFSLDGPGHVGLFRLMGGARIAFDSGAVTPAIFGRVGLHPGRGRPWGPWWWGGWLGPLGLEGGAALDANVAPNVRLGGHMGLNLLTNGFAYLNLGAHLAVKF